MKRFIAIVTFLFLLLPFSGYSNETDYASAKANVEKFLDANSVELEEIATQTLEDQAVSTSEFKDISYITFDESNNMVIFEIGSQGMLGGQYWSLVYCKDGTFHGEFELYTYNQPGGNNLVLAEKLQENWFFCWEDYDGREDLISVD